MMLRAGVLNQALNVVAEAVDNAFVAGRNPRDPHWGAERGERPAADHCRQPAVHAAGDPGSLPWVKDRPGG